MLSGYKTYITAALAILGAGAGWATGDMTVQAAAQMIVTALLGAFIRGGITSVVKPVVHKNFQG
jgi:VIT1/CCC1 family predicted Fe2+/Mn2+ transporter